MPLAHIQIHASDLERSTAFFLEALKPLGYKMFMKHECFVGLASGFNPDFWISNAATSKRPVTTGVHIAFNAGSKKKVREVYNAAM